MLAVTKVSAARTHGLAESIRPQIAQICTDDSADSVNICASLRNLRMVAGANCFHRPCFNLQSLSGG
jgi:hypothetical protein